jgi:hypothetical protein
MEIKKFKDYLINEADKSHENPEEYIGDVLLQLKNKLEKIFTEESIEKDSEISFKQMGIKLESIEICNFSKMYDSLQIKYSDDKNYYTIFFIIKLDQAMDGKVPSEKSIKKCFIKFRKYELKDLKFIGKMSKEVNIEDINKDMLISIKDEFDNKYGINDDDDLKIEFEE